MSEARDQNNLISELWPLISTSFITEAQDEAHNQPVPA